MKMEKANPAELEEACQRSSDARTALALEALMTCQQKQIIYECSPAQNYKTYDSDLVSLAISVLSAAPADAVAKDTERLDWMLSHPDATICNEGPGGPFHIWFRYSNRTMDSAPTARAAIDAAISAQKGGA